MKCTLSLIVSLLVGNRVISAPCPSVATYNIEDFGAVGDNSTDDTAAIRAALSHAATAAASSSSADRRRYEVLVPAGGIYKTAPINVTSNLTLRVEGTLRGIANESRFPLVPVLPSYGRDLDKPGMKVRRHPLVWAIDAINVRIVGGGIIDGAGPYWWPIFNRRGGTGRPHLMELYNCTDVEVYGVTLLNSPFWTLHPVYSTRVHIHHVNITTPIYTTCNNTCSNTDGIDVDSCSHVLIENNYISCGDDHVTVLSGMGEAGRRYGVPSFNVTVRNNVLGTGMGLSIGSSVSGGVEHVRYVNNTMRERPGDWGQGMHVKTRLGNGGYIRDILYQDNIFHSVGLQGILLETSYQSRGIECNDTVANCFTDIANITFRDIAIEALPGVPGTIGCHPRRPCSNITIRNVHARTNKTWTCKNVASGTFENVSPSTIARQECGMSGGVDEPYTIATS